MTSSVPGNVTPFRWSTYTEPQPMLPEIKDDEPFNDMVKKLSFYIVETVHTQHTFDELKLPKHGACLNPLIRSLSGKAHHPATIAALMALKAYFATLDSNDEDQAINATRGFACEVVAWRFVTHLSDREAIEYLLFELPPASGDPDETTDPEAALPHRTLNDSSMSGASNERTRLLYNETTAHMEQSQVSNGSSYWGTEPVGEDDVVQEPEEGPMSTFQGLNALEIAAVADAKKFLSQRVIQRIIDGIWNGDIILWESLNVDSVKRPKMYNKRKADPYSRLRVPKYLKAFEVVFFVSFLVLYYATLMRRNVYAVTTAEILLYIWILAFAYDEFGEFRDAGTLFYAADFWSLWDIGIVGVGAAFFVSRMVGLNRHSFYIIDISFDILSLEALFLVPRIFSLLSLNPYFGTLIPCLKEMTKDFIKFLSLVVILYLGFLTTFTLLARDRLTLSEMSWVLIKVFFGSSYLGFDVAKQISPILGPPLMLIFICLTNILLITSLISLLSNSLSRVLEHARDEYIYIYSVYVLEASTSNRLTYYLPPLNLIPLLFRPMRFFISSEKLRSARIVLLKVTHFPYVAAITAYENGLQYLHRKHIATSATITSTGGPSSSPSLRRLKTSLNNRPLVSSATVMQTSGEGTPPVSRSPVVRPGHKRMTTSLSEGHESEDLRSLILEMKSQIDVLIAQQSSQDQQEDNEGM